MKFGPPLPPEPAQHCSGKKSADGKARKLLTELEDKQ